MSPQSRLNSLHLLVIGVLMVVQCVFLVGCASQKWLIAAESGDVNRIQALLREGKDVDAQDEGMTALMSAAWFGRRDAVTALLNHGAQVDRRNNSGWTALMYNVMSGFFETDLATCLVSSSIGSKDDYDQIVSLLLSKGADPNASDLMGLTPLMLTALSGRISAAESLLAHGALIDAGTQHRSYSIPNLPPGSVLTDFTRAEVVVHWGYDKRNPRVKALASSSGLTALMLAAISGRKNMVELLLSSNASVGLKDSLGRTASICADEAGHHDLAAIIKRRE